MPVGLATNSAQRVRLAVTFALCLCAGSLKYKLDAMFAVKENLPYFLIKIIITKTPSP